MSDAPTPRDDSSQTPQFTSFIPSVAHPIDAEYETDAVLDHIIGHSNTPPFMAHGLIQ